MSDKIAKSADKNCPKCDTLLRFSTSYGDEVMKGVEEYLSQRFKEEALDINPWWIKVKKDSLSNRLNTFNWDSFEEEFPVLVKETDDWRHVFFVGGDDVVVCGNCGCYKSLKDGGIVDLIFYDEDDFSCGEKNSDRKDFPIESL